MQNNIKELETAFTETKKYITFLEKNVKSSELDGLVIQEIENCAKPFGNYYAVSHYEDYARDGRRLSSYSYSCNKNSPETTAEICRKMNDENLKWAEVTHQTNLPKIAINEKIRTGISALMGRLGVPSSYRVSVKTRSRFPKYENQNSGWVNDINKICISDNYENAIRAHAEFEKRIVDYLKKKEEESRKAKLEEEKAKAEKESVLELARMQVKYGNFDDWDDLLEEVLKKDKYLALGHALYKNRSDWNEGYSYAEWGLNNFVAETEQDKEIEKELYGLIGENWDGDGRCFRDCNYNYTFLFNLVDIDLYKDYELIWSKNKGY